MNTRCKFQCTSAKKYKGWLGTKTPYLYEYEFMAVTGGSPENDSFFASTPTGQLKFSAVADDGAGFSPRFEPGKEYYLYISDAPIIEAADG